MITDAAVARALGDALGHSAPFSADELATLRGPVVVRGARKLEGLGDCTALEELTLLGCALEDTAVIGRMSNLRRLHVLCSTMDDVAPLAVPPLELLELNFSVVRDATPLLASRSLRVLRAYGVPWDVESYDITLYEWRLGDHGEPAPAIELSRTSEWLVCRALFEAGVEACLATLPGRWTALVRPGIHAGQDYCEGYPEQMVPALAKATPTSWSDATATGFRTTSLADAPVDRFRVEWESGTDADARRWVASASLDDGDAAALERFIGRFSDATFWREPAAMQAVEEKRLSTRIPSRLARLRSDVLAGIRPDERYLRVRVDGFDHDGPHGVGDGWFVIGLLGYGNDERRTLLHDELGLFPIGDSVVEAGYTELAINLRDSDDSIVYEYRTQELFHARSGGKPARVLVRPAFASIASMLGHVTAYSLDDRVVEGVK